jgi:hypothetical protein
VDKFVRSSSGVVGEFKGVSAGLPSRLGRRSASGGQPFGLTLTTSVVLLSFAAILGENPKDTKQT